MLSFWKRVIFLKNGFTLVELLVVTSIILIISAAIFPGYGNIRGQLLLDRSAHKLSQDIRKAGEMAMSAKLSGAEVPNGYGIYIVENQTSYLLYSDLPPVDGNERYNSDQDGIIETIQLETGVKIESVTPSPSVSINYKPPSPRVKISDANGIEPVDKTATIILSLISNPSRTKTVKVNAAGLVDIY